VTGGLLEAVSFFKGNSNSPSSSEEAVYQFALVEGGKGEDFEDLYKVNLFEER
jgi:hypothetical protein